MESTVHCLKRLWSGPLYPPEAPAVAALFVLLTIGFSALIVLLALRAERKAGQRQGPGATTGGKAAPPTTQKNERP